MSEEYYRVKTSFGTLCGTKTELNGKSVVRFLGIPYAQQPVGSLRFEPLKPLEEPLGSEDTPFMALTPGPSSWQVLESFFATQLPMSESCIYLNVYSPLEANQESLKDKRYPVFFHIHGGAFIRGSGSEPYYDMTSFSARHEAVAVSINYRLSLLGFLSLPPLIQENLGLLDQQFALKWVHENISCFGGDPDNVTIFGCSAGLETSFLQKIKVKRISGVFNWFTLRFLSARNSQRL